MMDIIINSLYQNKDIFLRELISNASDALDKIRYLALTASELLGEGDSRELDIKVSFDAEAKTLTIRDKGIGMTKQDLIENLGTIAKSGTSAFMEQIAGSESNLIGQFGVGFYSVYLVADKVRVVSKHNDDEQYVWESSADDTFRLALDPRGNTLGRGSEITLFLKDDAKHLLDQNELENLIKRYSEFITFPIYLKKSEEKSFDVEMTEDEKEEARKKRAEEKAAKKDEKPEGEEDEDDDDEEDDDADVPTTKKESRTVWDWNLINSQKAIWTRPTKDVTEEEYNSFYKTITKSGEDPLEKIHFKAEGEIDFKSILYIPKANNPASFEKYYEQVNKLKLYVKKVMIAEQLEDLLPRYLNFIVGVVDSDDLPLNVSRETLQQHKVLKVMGKKLTRKVLEMLRNMAKGSASDAEEGEEEKKKEEKEEVESKESEEKKKNEKYETFWKEFGKNIKLGVIEDGSNRTRLSKLLRFHSSKTEGDKSFTSLEEYVSRMKEWQKDIYFIAGESVETVQKSGFMDKFNKKEVEVLYLIDPLDEYVTQHLSDFDGKKLTAITKEGVKLGDEGEDDEKRMKLYKEKFTPLTKFLKGLYGSKVEKVVVSDRLENAPSMLVTGAYGHSANMERIMKAQAFGDPSRQAYMFSKKTMEINPRHPLIAELLKDVETSGEDAVSVDNKDLSWLLFDTALLNSGFQMEEPQEFSKRMYRLMQKGLSIESLELLEPIPVPVEEPKKADDDEEEDDGEVDFDSDDKDEL